MSVNNQQGTLAQYVNFLIRWRWAVVISSILVTFLIGSFATKLKFNNDYEVFFGADNPQLMALKEMQNTYNKTDNTFLIILPKDGRKVFEPEVLAAVEEITQRANEELPFTLRVDSITNFQNTVGDGDDLIVAPLIEDALSLSPEQIANAEKVAKSEPLIAKRLMSTTHEATAVNITYEMPHAEGDETGKVVSAVRKLATDIEAKHPVDIHITGVLMINNAFMESTEQDISTLFPLMYGIIVLLIFFLSGSLIAAIGVLIVITLSIVITLGLTSLVGIDITSPTGAAPTIITTLAVADSIHFLMTMLTLMRKGMSKEDALREAMRIDFKPLLLTSVTTSIGFLSLNFSDSPPFQDLGNMTAMGVMAAFFFSIFFLPSFLSIMPVKVKQDGFSINDVMGKLGKFIIQNRIAVFSIGLIISFILLSFIPQNKFRDDFVKYFDTTVPFRIASDLANEKLSGFIPVEISIDAQESNGISEPEFIQKLDQLETWLYKQPEVGHVSIISDTFKRLNKNLHSDDQSYYKVPETRQEAAQYLLLYELSLPMGLDLNNQINLDKSATKVSVIVADMPSDELIKVTERIEQYASKLFDQDIFGVSSALMFAHISERNTVSMLQGTLSALVLISFILIFALRSVRLGLISIVPNLLPAGLAFGVWAIYSGEINLAVSAVTGMTLGIVVDDTIHLMSQYNYARRVNGYSKEDAIIYAFEHVGTALVITTIVLTIGYSVLAQSSFGLNSDSGKLTAITIVIALIADLALIPCLLLWLDKKDTETNNTTTTLAH